MIQFLLYYAIATVILAAVDAIRIWAVLPRKKKNIRKWISWSLGIAAAVGCWILSGFPGWLSCIEIAVGVRYFLYDPVLNIFRGRRIDYESDSTNSTTDKAENFIGLSFWAQRVIGAMLAGWPFLINWIKSIQ